MHHRIKYELPILKLLFSMGKTKQPIDSVLCKVLTGSEMQYSDVVEFSKSGYQIKKVKNPKDVHLDK